MQIHQFNVSYNDRQDRLLLRVSTQSGEEYRFWLTRRLTLRLMPALQETVARLEASQPQMVANDAASRQILTDLKRDSFLQNADFETPYADQARLLPLGESPMLVSDVEFRFHGSLVQLTLQDKGTAAAQLQSCQLNLPASLLHGLIHLMQQAATKAEWQTASQNLPAAQDLALPATPAAGGYRH